MLETIQIALKRAKNPNWQEVNQMAIYKHGRGFERGIAVNKSSKWPERGLNSWPAPSHKPCALTARSRFPPNEGNKDVR